MNGFLAEDTVNSVADILPWLQEAIARFYPDSSYAQSLEPAVKARAADRVFRPPRTGQEVRYRTAGRRTPTRDYLMSCWPLPATIAGVSWKSKHRR